MVRQIAFRWQFAAKLGEIRGNHQNLLTPVTVFLACGSQNHPKTRSRRAVTARSLVVYVNASADKLALRAVSRNVHEVFSGPALRAKRTYGFLRV